MVGRVPRTNARYWDAKLRNNAERDLDNERRLRQLGYRVVTLWECDLSRRPSWCIEKVAKELGRAWPSEPAHRSFPLARRCNE